MPRHFADLNAETIVTPSLVNAKQELRAVLDGRGIGIFWGDPGTGKDFGLAHACEELGFPYESWVRLRFAHAPEEREVCRRLMIALTGEEPTGRQPALQLDELAEIQREQHTPILVEEAQHWARVGFGSLRQIYDQSEESFALLLVGSEDFPVRLRRFGCLDRRAIGRQHFRGLDRSAVLEHIPRYHHLYHAAKPEVIAMVDQALCLGRLGYWAAFTHKAVICANGRSTLTQHFAQELLRGQRRT